MNISQAARELGVSRKVIYRMLRDGHLHGHRDPILVGGEVLIPRQEVEAKKALRLAESRPPYGGTPSGS